jgi:hypothetical protein
MLKRVIAFWKKYSDFSTIEEYMKKFPKFLEMPLINKAALYGDFKMVNFLLERKHPVHMTSLHHVQHADYNMDVKQNLLGAAAEGGNS